MAGFGQQKRPYPGEWGAPNYSTAKQGRMDYYPPSPYGAPMGGGMYPGGYGGPSSYTTDYPDYSGFSSGVYGASNGAGNATQWGQTQGLTGTTVKKEAVDFTDDYQAFYGKVPFAGQAANARGRGQGQAWGPRGAPRGGPPQGNRGNRGGGQVPQQRGGFMQQRGGRGGRGQRGMPPNQFGRGRGRGNAKKAAAAVPPVHSLAKAVTSVPDLANMSMAEKMHRFCLFLKNDDSVKVNAIQTIVNACTSTKLGLKIEYAADELIRVAGKGMYTGYLKLDDVFLARAVNVNKKDLKQEVFQKAFDIMCTKTVAEIFNLKDLGKDAIKEELEEHFKQNPGIPQKAKSKSGMENSVPGFDVSSALEVYMNTLKNMESMPDNPISALEQAVSQSKCFMRHKYEYELLTLATGHPFFRGKVILGDIVIGRGRGMTKKACRQDSFQRTLDRLMSKTVDELLVSVPEEPLPNLVPKMSSTTKLSAQSKPIEERFKELIQTLVTMPFKDNNINPFDVSSMLMGLTPTLVYRTLPKSENVKRQVLQCELYLDKILLASSEGYRRKDLMIQAYNAAWEVLTTTPVDTILSQHKRITDDEFKNPEVIDIIVKGGIGKTTESNAAGLKRYGFDLNTVENNRLEDLVIIEHNDWAKERDKNAFCILQFSCVQNGLVLQWESESCNRMYKGVNSKCSMYIQKQLVGWSYGQNKFDAKHNAAKDALFQLYEKCPVLKVAERNDEDKWIPWASIVKEADELRSKSVKEEPAAKTDEDGTELPDPFIMKVLKSKLDAITEETGELIIGPGIGHVENRSLRYTARMQNLKCDTRQYQGQPYWLIYTKLSWQKMVEILRNSKVPYGKFKLASMTDLPKHADIEDHIKQNPTQYEEEAVTEFT